jgi:hypothetical protein
VNINTPESIVFSARFAINRAFLGVPVAAQNLNNLSQIVMSLGRVQGRDLKKKGVKL